MNGRGLDMLKETLDFLVNYTERHFADEEELMQKYAYPAFEDHRKFHEDFKITVSGLVEDFKTNGSSQDLLEKVNSIIVRWLVQHIKQEDYRIVKFIQEQIPAGSKDTAV
jgi:hemerythrin